MRGLRHEGAELFRWSADCLRESCYGTEEERRRMLAMAMAFQGECTTSLSHVDAMALIHDSLELVRDLPVGKETLYALIFKSVYTDEGEKRQLTQIAFDLARANHGGWWIPKLIIDLAHYAITDGEYQKAEALLQEALAMSRESGGAAIVVNILMELGHLVGRQGDYPAAYRVLEEAVTLAQDIGYTAAVWWSNTAMGDNALRQGDYARAESHYQAALAVCRALKDEAGIAVQLCGLGYAACGLGQYDEARQHFYKALQLNEMLGVERLTLDVIAGTALIVANAGQIEYPLELAAFVVNHPGSWELTKTLAKQVITLCESHFALEEFHAIIERSNGLDIQAVLKGLSPHLTPSHNGLVSSPAEIDHLALDALTERELDVLRLIAEGFSNYEIATQLFVGVSTVKTHINHIFSKLCVKSRTQAVARARELRLL